MKFITVIVLGVSLLCLLGLGARPALCQPIPETKTGTRLNVAATEKGLFVTLSANDVSASQVLQLISTQTNTEIIVKDDAVISEVEFENLSPQEALAKVAQAANLAFKLDDGI